MTAHNKLTDVFARNAAPGKHNDGGGLWLYKRASGASRWVFRYTFLDRRPEMGLGTYPGISLLEARKQAAEWRNVLLSGKNPQKERKNRRKATLRAAPTLEEMVAEAFEARRRQLVEDGRAGRWDSPLRLHVLPMLGSTPIDDIDQRDIKRALAPIWHTKAETARKAINRLGLVFEHAAAAGIDVDLQATAKAKALLGAQGDTVTHIPALDWREVPAFYASLEENTLTHLALRFLILTALRSKPVRFLRSEFIKGDILTVPAELMKGARGKTSDFQVPLSDEALAVIETAREFERDGYLFPSVRKGVISDATMSRYMERRGMKERPHGFRSSFRTWCAEATVTPQEVAETCLAHVAGSKVVVTYRRTDFLEQRKILMERWAEHVSGRIGEIVRLAQ
ncbi:MAG: integrase arm-type DNA-binding domain-containing protein [Rhodobacteraceae bacterium]|nr:integrase arm-type DNA-binding domain-containing protein [Paracoccaceae bacterium]